MINKKVKVFLSFIAKSILFSLRYSIFFIMSALRGPIHFLCGLYIFSATIAIPLIFFGVSSTDSFKWPSLTFLIVGLLICSAIQWFYDSLLIKLSTRDLYLTY